MKPYHHARLPNQSTLRCGHIPTDENAFKSDRLQIWYNNTDASWVGAGEQPHQHTQSDECFIVLRGVIVVEVGDERFMVGPREFCCFPAGSYHAIVEVQPPLETLMIRAPSVADKVCEHLAGGNGT
jgi:mannose-6-phosphate isomerase-like protein (cupin superfamily)